jgi:hypothetical protein
MQPRSIGLGLVWCELARKTRRWSFGLSRSIVVLFVARTEMCPETCHFVNETTTRRYKEAEQGLIF